MNQTQANRVVKVLQFFEELEDESCNLSSVRVDTQQTNRKQVEDAASDLLCALDDGQIENLPKVPELVIGECSTIACFTGWLPNIFPRVLRA